MTAEAKRLFAVAVLSGFLGGFVSQMMRSSTANAYEGIGDHARRMADALERIAKSMERK